MNPGTPTRWTADNIQRALSILSQHRNLDDALGEMSREFGFEVTRPGAYSAFTRAGYRSPFTYLQPTRARNSDTTPGMPAIRPEALRPDPVEVQPVAVDIPVELDEPGNDYEDETNPGFDSSTSVYRTTVTVNAKFERLVELTKKYGKKGGLDLETVCDELELTPREARELIEEARSHGVIIEVAHDKLHIRPPEAAPSQPPVDVAPSGVGAHHRVAVFSDLHFGSKYCLRPQLAKFVTDCYNDGIRDFFCPGDLLEGCYRHAQWELSASSWEDQALEFLESLPQLPGMRIFFIDGNHDYTWTDRTGVESGRNLVRLAEEMGRTDLFFFGSRGALINYGGTRIELWHPKKGNGYALSYQLQNKIRDTAPERLPHILLTGHTHQYVQLRRSNVWAFYCGTFQHGDAPYGRSLGGDVTMGGIILEWTQDPDGAVRKLSGTLVLAYHAPKTFDVEV